MTKRATLLSTSANTAIAPEVACASAQGEPLKTIQLLPIGPIKSKRDGRQWLIRDAAHAQAIVDASIAAASPADIPMDYDHQLMFAAQPGVGGQAPASGWLSNLRVDGDFIVADVDWTEAAAAKIKAREYRYVSPVFAFTKSGGEVTRIAHGALTNFPAITELAAVASVDPDGASMDLTALAAALGLPATATLDECVAAATAARTAATAIVKTMATAAGVPETGGAEGVAAAIAARVDPATRTWPRQLCRI